MQTTSGASGGYLSLMFSDGTCRQHRAVYSISRDNSTKNPQACLESSIRVLEYYSNKGLRQSETRKRVTVDYDGSERRNSTIVRLCHNST
jgi:hypothetical protein